MKPVHATRAHATAAHMPRAHTALGRRLAPLAPLAWVLVALALITVGTHALGLRVQHTGSLPRGLYRAVRGPPVRGAIGVWCLPAPTGRWARARGYLRAGGCPGHVEPIGKAVLAVGGDEVRFGPDGVTVNGRRVAHTRPVARDVRGAPVPHVAFGTYVLSSGWVWLWSPYTDRSFDSRYFGPVSTRALVTRVRPVWTVP